MKIDESEILNKKFDPTSNGYDPEQVDEFLDVIIESFSALKESSIELSKEAMKLKEENQKLRDQIHKLEISNQMSSNKLSGINNSSNVTGDNINLIKRINELEKFLYQNGFNPSKIK